jgi:hemolysin activation/secretion protein
VSKQLVERILYAALPRGKPIAQRQLERGMLSVMDLPGIAVQSFLEAGEETGRTNLVVDVSAARRRWDASAEFDNHGSRFTGEYRFGLSARLKSPFKFGDLVDARILGSPNGGLAYGRIAYEAPAGPWGTRLGLGYTSLHYDLGKEFDELGATGNAQIGEVTLNHSLIRSRESNLVGKLSFEHKDLTDRFESVGSRSDKRVRNFGAGLGYEARDGLLGGGYLNLGLSAYRGHLDLDTPSDLTDDQGTNGRHTDGGFTKVVYLLSRLQSLGATSRSLLYLGLTGQWAEKNLDSAEKIALGGPRAIRAYAPSEALVDEGQILNFEYRYSFDFENKKIPGLTLSAFFDRGWGRISTKPGAAGETDNRRALGGYGLEAFWGDPESFALRTSLAFRGPQRGRSDPHDRNPRLYLQFVKAF